MILTPQELRNFNPSLSVLNDLELEGLIARSQGLCESHLGANRELEEKEYLDIKTVTNSHLRLSLIYFPLIEIISIEINYGCFFDSYSGIGGGVPVGMGWEAVPEEEYSLVKENEDGSAFLYLNSRFSPANSLTYFGIRNRPMQGQKNFPQLRIRYNAGFDFSQESAKSSPKISQIKAMIAGVAEVMYREQKGIKEESSQGAKIVYFQNFQNLNPYANYLPFFHKYRPRT
jgi:hypothetical protein